MWIFLGIVGGGIIISFILILITASRVYRSMFNKRYNDNHTLKYFTVEDFEGLKKEDLSFTSNKGQLLAAHLYYYPTLEEYKGLLVLSHGLGAGHLQYTTEINYFAKLGYKVFAFDYTGCLDSEGKIFPGFPQTVIDLKYALEYIDSLEELKNYKKVIYGHSMGAYAAVNVLNYYDNIKAVVSLSPFDESFSQVAHELETASLRNMKPYGFVFKLFDKHRFKSYSKVSTKQTLLNTKVPVYVIAADRDTIVNSVYNFEEFKEACKDDETKKFLLVKDRFHRPNLTLEGAKYDNDTNEEYYRLYLENKCEIPQEKKDEFYGGLDYNKLVEMDEVVMSSIASFLEENLSN